MRKLRVAREDGETDRRSDGVRPRRERDLALTDDPVQAAPDEGDREDDERHPDEEALPEALVRRVVRIRADGGESFGSAAAMTGERRRPRTEARERGWYAAPVIGKAPVTGLFRSIPAGEPGKTVARVS